MIAPFFIVAPCHRQQRRILSGLTRPVAAMLSIAIVILSCCIVMCTFLQHFPTEILVVDSRGVAKPIT